LALQIPGTSKKKVFCAVQAASLFSKKRPLT
jgi:hypothetical protein